MASMESSRFSSTCASLGILAKGPIFGQHAHQLLERTHFANLAQLIAKIFEREIVLAKLALQFAGLFSSIVFLGLFDQGENVAHAEDAGDDAVGIERLDARRIFRRRRRT